MRGWGDAARLRRGAGVLCSSVLLLALAMTAHARPPADLVWRIDPAQSAVRFSIRVAWLRRLEGTFGGIEGEVRRDADGMHALEVRIPVTELSMGDPDHERWARSAEFFAADRYPWIAFRAERISDALLREGGPLHGELMLRGIRGPQQLQLEPSDCARPGRDCPLQARAELRRSGFGMTARRVVVGDRVRLRFSIWLEDPR